ncbi:Eco57I restriction-modification methylase domain-containing protein [Helicobacter typhlonius]|uniref:Eco57I restriction-modification methylase domain-containing protein n=1 Tax=Helicobacter typhlonius TaxID=76936 RepID=UPI002FE041EB
MSAVESSKTLDIFLNNAYKHEHFQNFIIESFGKNIDIKTKQRTPYDKHNSIITSYSQMCENITLDSQSLSIYAFKTTSINAKITLHKEIAEIIKNQPEINAMLAVFYDESKEFRLSLVTQGFDYEKNKTTFSNLRRQSFTLGENTKTKTAKLQLQGFLDKEKTLKNLQEAFSTEPISKEFYRDYERLYKDLSQKLCQNQATFNVLDNYEGLNGEKAVNAFVKKLLGRIVFLYFLQKKGWLGVAQNASYGEGDKNFLFSLFSKATQNNEFFYTKYLCPLFFETLNTQRENDYSPHFDCKIPFLNGGLFEEYKDKQGKGIERDFVLTQSLENTDFEAIFDVFENYNFTIEESTPDNQEIGIDPEMLGKVFENLIDYNKSSGAFYTPREIVHFMCKNVLTRTLQERISQDDNSLEAHKDSLYNFIFYKQSDDFIAQNAKQLTQAITSLKILDPAIGSGAFPMGMLSEILEALHTLNPSLQKQDLARYKREIIEQHIYGIDIDADAIEIAKLRFWLSIAVDEDTPSPLPNLDFKFMQGNALIESINGIEIIPSDLNAPQHQKDLWGKTSNANASLFDKSQTNKLEALFLQYYEPNAQKAQLKAEILAIMKEAFDERIKQIDENIQSIKANPAIKPKERAKQQEKILQYESFKHDLDALLKDYEEHNFHTDKLFLYRFFFAPIFAQGGFDIIIGNPPYIRQEKIPNKQSLLNAFQNFQLEKFKGKSYNLANSSADIFTYFYVKSLDLLKNEGFLSFITSNKWCRAGYGKNLREFILDFKLDSHYDFNGVKIFESAQVDTAITTLQYMPNKNYALCFLSFTKEDNDISEVIKNKQWLIPQDSLSTDSFIFTSPEITALKAKIEKIGTPLKEWDISIYRGILTGYNEAFIIDSAKRDEILRNCVSENERQRTSELIKPILRGRDIKRYSYEWAGLWIINTHNGYTTSDSSLTQSLQELQQNASVITDKVTPSHFASQPTNLTQDTRIAKDIESSHCETSAGSRGNPQATSKIKIPPIDIADYPALKAHLDTHWDKIAKRADKGTTPYNLRNCAYLEEFEKEKIVWNPVSGEYFFTHIKETMYFNNSLFMMTIENTSLQGVSETNNEAMKSHQSHEVPPLEASSGVWGVKGGIRGATSQFKPPCPPLKKMNDKLLYILGLMNSTLYKWLITQMTNLVETGKYAYGAKDKIERLPIPKVDSKTEAKFIQIVQEIVESKKQGRDTKELESTLDAMVCKLYNLSDDEIRLVESMGG